MAANQLANEFGAYHTPQPPVTKTGDVDYEHAKKDRDHHSEHLKFGKAE